MKRLSIRALLFIFVAGVFFTAGCGASGLNSPLSDEAGLSNKSLNRQFIDIAYRCAKDAMEIKDPENASIQYQDDLVIVTFLLPKLKPGQISLRAEYIARVTIDRKSKKVIKALVGS